ncbi:MAG: Gfo/Idh/MocA family oxidoreductase [Spirochaetaceae bacterium]|nr:Gfo/Idh/MocA family oxidoreductase [Spirochaetaceae bacterium]
MKAAIVGLGRIGSLLEEDPLREKPCTHAGAIRAEADCVLAAGADTDGERRRLFGKRWGCPVYADAETMLRETSPDILHIATHPDSHGYYCALAAACHVPVAVCEKPLADTLGRARKIAALHRSGKIKIITNHERRYAADYRQARTILKEGRLGRVLGVNARLCMGKTRRLLDVLWHDGTHLADALMFLSGCRLRHKKAWGSPLSRGTGTAFLLGFLYGLGSVSKSPAPAKAGDSFQGDIPFLFEVGAERDHLVFELEFSCSQGRLRIGNGLFEVWESIPSPYAEGFRSLTKTETAFTGPTGYFANMVKDAVRCVRDSAHEPRSGAADGLEVIRYLKSIRAWT